MSKQTLIGAQKKLELAKKQVASLEEHINTLRGMRPVPCQACTASHRICDLDLIKTHWYVKPSGCTDGDYWNEGEWRFSCPLTGVQNRLLFDDPYEARMNGNGGEVIFKRLYEKLFKSVSSTYEKCAESWVNNTYIDKHRKEFELPEGI